MKYMQDVLEPSGYFSEEEMRHRAPQLYEEYVGQHLDERAVREENERICAQPFSEQLVLQIQRKERRYVS